MVLSRGPRRRSTTTRLTKRRRRRARGRLSSVSTAPTCLSTARTSRGRSGHRSQLKDSEYIPLLRKMPESVRELLTTWRPRVKKPMSPFGGGHFANAKTTDVAFRWRALCECEDSRCRLSVEGTLRMRRQPTIDPTDLKIVKPDVHTCVDAEGIQTGFAVGGRSHAAASDGY